MDLTNNVIFDNDDINGEDDALFLLLNVFAHDFFHDFNMGSATMRDRLFKSIKGIRNLSIFVGGENSPDAEDLVEIPKSVQEEYLFCNNLDIFNEWNILYPRNPIFLRTRSDIRKYQNIKNTIDEIKLYIMGKIDTVDIETRPDTSESTRGGTKKNENDIKHYFEKHIIRAYNIVLYEIHKTNDTKDKNSEEIKQTLKNLITMMKYLFLMFKDTEDVHPLDIFNNIWIETAVIIAIYQPNFFMENNTKKFIENISKIISFLQKSDIIQKNNIEKKTVLQIPNQNTIQKVKMIKGGDINETIFNLYKELQNSDDLIILSKATNPTNTVTSDIRDNCKSIYLKYIERIVEISNSPDNKNLQKEIKKILKNYKIKIEKNATSRNVRIFVENVNTFLNEINNIISSNINIIKKSIAKIENIALGGEFSNIEKDTVQQICKIIAYGVINYFLPYPTFRSRRATSSLLNHQLEVINNVLNDGAYGGIDKNLRVFFTKYLQEYPQLRDRYLYFSTNDVVNTVNNNSTDFRIINNASPKAAPLFTDYRNKTLCPISSKMDAMAGLGGCVKSTLRVNQEMKNMNFKIGSKSDTIFYSGKVIQKKIKDFNKGAEIVYTANCSHSELASTSSPFSLPEVKIEVDINSDESIIISANNTFDSLTTEILSIWKIVFRDITPSNDELWSTLQDVNMFKRVISVGSGKSVGDFYQEITSTIKNGGYTTSFPAPEYIRLGLMGDQPSGVRAAFILFKSNIEDLYPKSIAGFFSPSDDNTVAVGTILPVLSVRASVASKGKTGKTGGSTRKIRNKSPKKSKSRRLHNVSK